MALNQAQEASLRSREFVHAHDKEGWLALFAEDGVIQDPIGPSHLDAAGLGHSTPAQREAFYDSNIANTDITITIHQSYGVANECANHVTLNMKYDLDGKKYSQEVNGVFTYAVNAAGKLTALRGFWEIDESMKTIKPVE